MPSPDLFTILLPMKPAIKPSTIQARIDMKNLLKTQILGAQYVSCARTVRSYTFLAAINRPLLKFLLHSPHTYSLSDAKVPSLASNRVFLDKPEWTRLSLTGSQRPKYPYCGDPLLIYFTSYQQHGIRPCVTPQYHMHGWIQLIHAIQLP